MILTVHLGLEAEEYTVFLQSGADARKQWLDVQCHQQRFRIYQLNFDAELTIPFAFLGIEAMHKSGYKQPPAAKIWSVSVSGFLLSQSGPSPCRQRQTYVQLRDPISGRTHCLVKVYYTLYRRLSMVSSRPAR